LLTSLPKYRDIFFSFNLKIYSPKADRFVGKFLKQSEAIELFEAVKGHKLELGVILGAFYGLRRSEAVGLKWSAIDFESNTITIEHTVTTTRFDGKSYLIEDDTTKSKSSFRTLPLVSQFRIKLLELKQAQETYRELCGNSYDKTEGQYVYVNQLGKRIKPGYLTTTFPEFLVKNGFRRMRYHDLRHSCASLLLANGISLKQIQEWLGHSDFAITANTYAHLEYKSKLQAADAMTWIGKTSLGLPEPVKDSEYDVLEEAVGQ
jgi:integrase